MKNSNKLLVLLISLTYLSCSSVRVSSDYNSEINFSSYKTYAFSKKGIDKAQINELDKKRILKALEIELSSLGLRKNSIDPDVVVSIFTAANEEININNSYNSLGYSYGPWYDFNYSNYSTTQGTLYIDIIDYKIPLGFIGRLANPILVKPKLNEIFNYRKKKLVELFGELK